MKKLVIDPVVRAILGPSQVSQLADMREHTDTVCVACGGSIRPEDPAPATVVLGVSEDTVLYIRLAHERCAQSQVYEIEGKLDMPALLADVSFVAYPILRAPPVVPRAMIVFEFARTVAIEELGGDQQRQAYLKRGWEPVTDSLDRVSAARVDGLCVRLRDNQIVVDDVDGEIIAFSNATAPPGWWEAAVAEDGCLLLYGSGLGLDRISIERLNTALQASACAAATARVNLSARPEPVASADEITSPADAPGKPIALPAEGDHGEIVRQAPELFGYAHVRLVTGYFARYKRDSLRPARKASLSAAETADRMVQEMGHGPEAKLLLNYVEANRHRIADAVWIAVQTRDDPHNAVAAWIGEHEIEAYAQVRDALRQQTEPPQ